MLVAVFLSAVPAGVPELQPGVTITKLNAQTMSQDSHSSPKRRKKSVLEQIATQPPTLKHVSTPPSSGKKNSHMRSFFNEDMAKQVQKRRKIVIGDEGEEEGSDSGSDSGSGSNWEDDS